MIRPSMKKYRKTLLRNRRGMVNISQFSRWEKIGQIVANLSQVLLVALAIFGYFYTVLPVYEKALLDEDIAKKTLELDKKNDELQEADAHLKEISIRLVNAESELKSAQSAVKAAQSAEESAKEDRARSYHELRFHIALFFSGNAQVVCGRVHNFGEISAADFSRCVEKEIKSEGENLSSLDAEDQNLLKHLAIDLSRYLEKDFLSIKNEYLKKMNEFDERKRVLDEEMNAVKSQEKEGKMVKYPEKYFSRQAEVMIGIWQLKVDTSKKFDSAIQNAMTDFVNSFSANRKSISNK